MGPQVRTIYLDNSHLHLLSELRRNTPGRFSAFLKIWSSQGCALALSQTHLSEINRYADQVKREARYDLLEALMPIHCDVMLGDDIPASFLTLTNREIFRALIKQDLVSTQSSAAMKCVEGFPARLTLKEHINLLRQLSNVGIYRNFMDAFYEANRLGAAANSRPPQTKYEIHRLSEIRDTRIKPDDVADVLHQLEDAHASIANLDGLRDIITPAQVDEVISRIRSSIEGFLKRTEEVGSSSALAEYFGADPTDPATFRKPIDLMIQQHTFEFSLRRFLSEVCGEQDEGTLSRVVGMIMIEDCPGTWLKNAVQLRMRKAAPKDDPSNYYDLEHLSYLPYVDVLFADKRIVTIANQVLNSDELPSSLHGIHAPIAIPNSIESLERQISVQA